MTGAFWSIPVLFQAGDSAPEELATATQVQGQYMPIVHDKPSVELVKVTDEMKSFKAYAKLRVERMNQRQVGVRLKKAAEAEKEEKKWWNEARTFIHAAMSFCSWLLVCLGFFCRT